MIEQTLDYQKQPTRTGGFTTDMLPTSHWRLILHCEYYSCLAQRDEMGVWRNPFTNEPIEAVILDWEPI